MQDTELSNPFSARNICQTLLNQGYLSKSQTKELLQKKNVLDRKLENLRNQPGGHSATLVEVIGGLNMSRADDPKKPVDEEIIYEALAADWEMPYRKIDPLKLDMKVVTTTIPRNFAKKHLILPISLDDGHLTLATSQPLSDMEMEDIVRAVNMKVDPVVCTRNDILKLIDEFFGFQKSIKAAEHQFSGPSVDLGNLEQYINLKDVSASDQHIVTAVNHMLSYAFDQRASDIHIEPKREESMVRMRIDGVLHVVYNLPKNIHNAAVSRIKTMSRLNMAEKRRPQDGRIKADKGGQEVEIRVSTIPVAFGEKVVMRVMDPDVLFQDLENLGFSATDLDRYTRFIKMPHGIVLVTGPTGSGKSTTLYSTLRTISSPEINITTVEDPIEMIHEEFNQIGVQPAIDVTFSNILRNILRQDPDVIMIGEMRDLDTASNAVQAALTGHLVLSTLHTNDAPTSVTRLLDLGLPAYLIQSTLIGIIAQRLVRRICNYCRAPFEMNLEQLTEMGIYLDRQGTLELYQGKGCHRCRGTGYLGREGIYEVLPYTEGIRQLTTSDTNLDALSRKAREEGMVTLRDNAVEKMLKGITTYQEVMRVTWEEFSLTE
ncbi:Type II secretory pathway, ATPase PulE/Tfp pilus assembly pathway, ATPase PilB [Olavius algarvensis associated proteobacterium Delta 3]|nr:Type II secretory pathway, ATPase PulE/Tfp pilus assembly pathway, ATPase PilB [Olavius algarvensis associated proteobacterium Delta 3]CAB5165108.1 Type II secretory pathway, ATPase PulE/Tfp pilus assembly pathway, ATPase PilB [Olavius algarvensis associated proteobacterium Delta 3]